MVQPHYMELCLKSPNLIHLGIFLDKDFLAKCINVNKITPLKSITFQRYCISEVKIHFFFRQKIYTNDKTDMSCNFSSETGDFVPPYTNFLLKVYNLKKNPESMK